MSEPLPFTIRIPWFLPSPRLPSISRTYVAICDVPAHSSHLAVTYVGDSAPVHSYDKPEIIPFTGQGSGAGQCSRKNWN